VDYQFVGPRGLARSSLEILKMVKLVERKNGFIEELKGIHDINLRYKKFSDEFLFGAKLANSYEIRAFIFLVARKYKKEGGLEIFGVCPYLRIKLKTETHRFLQFCKKSGRECSCSIPQSWCIERDGKETPPKYQNLLFIY